MTVKFCVIICKSECDMFNGTHAQINFHPELMQSLFLVCFHLLKNTKDVYRGSR